VTSVIGVTILTLVVVLLGLTFLSVFSLPNVQETPAIGVLVSMIALAVSALMVRFAVDIVKRDIRLAHWGRRARVARFAEANGLRYVVNHENPVEPGTIFAGGQKRRAFDCVTSLKGKGVTLGNYQSVGHPLYEGAFRRWGYLRIDLGRFLPHMILEARSNRRTFGRTNLPRRFSRPQKMSLEGDFDKHFTLYAPREYARDALYIFTPDLMVLLIDRTSAFDVEIVDHWMYLYSSKPFHVHKRETWEKVSAILDKVGQKVARQVSRYRDERASHPGFVIAPEGRRLRVRVAVIATVVPICIVALQTWHLFHL
jgi:hypothetical protein